MTRPRGPWTATIGVALTDPADARSLAAALAPESAREVPRAGASVRRLGGSSVEVSIWAADAGAMRAALNTYLGWIELSVATLHAAAGRAPNPGSG